MLGLYEFKDAGKSRKATSWITDPARFLLCSLLWPYFKRVLTEVEEKMHTIEEKMHTIEEKMHTIEEKTHTISEMQRAQNEAVASQTRLESRIDKLSIACEDGVARQSHLSARFEGLQKDVMAVGARLASLERLLIEYKEKNLQLEDGGKISIQGTSLVIAACKYGRFLLRRPDLISEAIISGQYWDPHLESIIERTGRQELVAIDAGSYCGFHSIHMARHFGQVYAFEPQMKMFQILCANILINEMGNIKAFNNALYDRECYMALAPDSMQEIPVPRIGGTVDYDRVRNAAALAFAAVDEKSADSIRGLTIDSLSLENVGLIKIDTQGSELFVLKGATETIMRSRPVIVLEYEVELSRAHGWDFAQCEEFFAGLDYDLNVLATQVEGKQRDYLATPQAI
jgi:FkbM family methyltransferase